MRWPSWSPRRRASSPWCREAGSEESWTRPASSRPCSRPSWSRRPPRRRPERRARPRRPGTSSPMRFLSDNLALKLVSLVLAGLLWFVIAGETTSEMGVSVPLELQNFPKDLELTGDAVDSVEVRLRASPGIMHALGPGQISAQIDLSGSGEGERIIHLTADSVRVPFGVKVVKIAPSLITLNFERTLQKVVP